MILAAPAVFKGELSLGPPSIDAIARSDVELARKKVAIAGPLPYHIPNAERMVSFQEGMKRMKGMCALFAAALCLMIVAGCDGKGGSREASKTSANASSLGEAGMWLPFNEGMALAAKENKHVVIDFYTTWCHWCKVMDRETFSNPEVKKYLAENFVTIRINAESTSEKVSYKGEDLTPVALARAFGVKGFPSLAYLDREGELVTIVPGFVPAKTFLPLLRYMQNECYKQQMTFEEFMKKKGECDTTGTK
jgi:thioredoxin-related protein